MTALTAGAPIEPPSRPVGRRTVTLIDESRESRRLDVDIWYPAVASEADRSVYEVVPGVAFHAAWAQHAPHAAAGQFPLVLFSHGRTGMRISYSQVCEALAARGAVVVSADHPGDALVDWLSGRHSDDRTNEVNRVGDAHLVLGAMLHGHAEIPADIAALVDPIRVVLAGHSYGAYTAYATAAGSRGADPHEHVAAVIGFQPYMRSMSDALLARARVPSLLVVSERDQVTPAHVDADRAWELLTGRPSWRLDLAGAGHQAISDIALYAELAEQVPNLPPIVRDYLSATAAENAPEWRSLIARQVAVAWAFIQVTLSLDAERGVATATEFEASAEARLQRR